MCIKDFKALKIELIEIDLKGVGPILFERSRKARKVSIRIKSPNQVRVAVPDGMSFEKAQQFVQSKVSWIKKNIGKFSSQINLSQCLDSIDVKYAKSYLIERLECLASQHGFSYSKVSIRNQKTRWGSCSADNNISLNIKLICLPKDLRDYVILHELAHTKIKNHSPSFWSFLSQYVMDVKKKDRALKGYSCA